MEGKASVCMDALSSAFLSHDRKRKEHQRFCCCSSSSITFSWFTSPQKRRPSREEERDTHTDDRQDGALGGKECKKYDHQSIFLSLSLMRLQSSMARTGK